MAVRITDRLINLTPPPSSMVPPTTFSPMSAHHGEQGDNIVSADPGGQRATPNRLGQSNVSSSQSFVTAPRRGRGLRTEANNSNDSNQTKGDQNEYQRNYKKRAECLEIFQDIQDALWQQFHQMQTIVFDSKEIECTLQELSIEEFDIELIRALRTLGNSLTGVRHILKGNIVMMEEAKAAPSPSSSVASSSTPQSDEHGMTSSRVGSPDTVETEPDLLLDDVTFDLEITGTSDVDGDQPIDNWNIALTEGDDPFVDTSGEDATIPLDLNYKPDAADIHMPASHTGIRSRRVILKNLPPDATLPLITRGIRCHGGLVSMMMINTAPIFGDNTKTAILEFMHHQSAVQFTNATNKSPLLYKAKNGDVYSADPWLVPSSSYGFGRIDRGLIDNKCTRVLLLKGFPKECIWYFINAVGMNNIAYADYDQSLDGFTVAFTSLFQANKADWLIFQGRFSDFYTINPQDAKFRIFLQDSTHVVERSRVNARQLETPIIHRSGDDFEEQWNRYPYNDYLPPHLRKAAAQSGPTRLSLKTRLALQYDIDESEVDDYLDDLEKYKDTEYRLIGSSITLKRRKWGWSISAEDENKLFLANTLHEPEWAEHWDEHFKSCGEINRRKWEHYGMVAKHRREKAAEQGLSLDSVPKCPKGCEMGCRDIKTVPAAPVVKKFFEKRY